MINKKKQRGQQNKSVISIKRTQNSTYSSGELVNIQFNVFGEIIVFKKIKCIVFKYGFNHFRNGVRRNNPRDDTLIIIPML